MSHHTVFTTRTRPRVPTSKQVDALHEVSERDRRWFAQRPGRRYRVRPITPAEIACHPEAAEQGLTHIIVEQIVRGFRSRTACVWCGPLPGGDEDVMRGLEIGRRLAEGPTGTA